MAAALAAGADAIYFGLDDGFNARARAENETRESEQRFRVIADTAPVLIWVTGQDGRRTFVNQTYVDFHGADYETARDLDWRVAIHPDDQARILAESVAGEASRAPFSLEARYRARERLLDTARVDLPAIGQLHLADAEDVALAIRRDDPALGDSGDKLAGFVEPDETLGGGGA